ncbi:glucooligosaccharide oxidase [Collybia nuda]|uniref:Glucooligosaccharide oxidase n=1 Tax=Collybia nuda TaxID=64659 RepID=A0A9P5Y2C6_9AGAR|nr:glucooligosaccharide oxidase [Collybia nuda]
MNALLLFLDPNLPSNTDIIRDYRLAPHEPCGPTGTSCIFLEVGATRWTWVFRKKLTNGYKKVNLSEGQGIYSTLPTTPTTLQGRVMILFHFLLAALASTVALAAHLKDSLNAAGIVAVFPGDPKYANASIAYNLRFEFKPAVVTFPKDSQDVSEILKISTALNMKAAARSGGHSYIANGLGGENGVVVLDMQNFQNITVNPSEGTAIIESGNRLGRIALTLSKHGRALPHGTCAYIGIGGHAAYGGFSFVSRMWGLTLDTITAGMRGSGGSFGIVTSIEVKTFPEPPSATTFEYAWTLDVDGVANGLGALQTYAQTNIPPEINAEIRLLRGPQMGTIVFHLDGVWYEAPDRFNATIAPLINNMPEGPNVTISTGTYIESAEHVALGSLDTSQPDEHDTFYAKSLMTPECSPISLKARTALAEYLATEGMKSTTAWNVEVELWGGRNSAINVVSPDATSFAHRSSLFTIQFYASSSLPPFPDDGLSFLDKMVDSIISNSPKDWDYGAYPNYIDSRLPDWQKRYYGAHYPRLRALKRKYDPQDIFDFPTAVEE